METKNKSEKTRAIAQLLCNITGGNEDALFGDVEKKGIATFLSCASDSNYPVSVTEKLCNLNEFFLLVLEEEQENE